MAKSAKRAVPSKALLGQMRKVSDRLRAEELTLEGQLNDACWLGERAHLLLNLIEDLQAGRPNDKHDGRRERKV